MYLNIQTIVCLLSSCYFWPTLFFTVWSFDLSFVSGLTRAPQAVAVTCPHFSPNWRARLLWLCPKSRRSSAKQKSVSDSANPFCQIPIQAQDIYFTALIIWRLLFWQLPPNSTSHLPFLWTGNAQPGTEIFNLPAVTSSSEFHDYQYY